jgi:hypothetical protein
VKYRAEVNEQGVVELHVPFHPGAHVTVFVIEDSEGSFDDMLVTTQKSLDFWDNPLDDEDWNYG